MAHRSGTCHGLSCLGIDLSGHPSGGRNNATFSDGKHTIHCCWRFAGHDSARAQEIPNQSTAVVGQYVHRCTFDFGGQWASVVGSTESSVGNDHLDPVAEPTLCGDGRLGRSIDFSGPYSRFSPKWSQVSWLGARDCRSLGFNWTFFSCHRFNPS